MTKKFLALLLITASLCVGNQFARAADPVHPDQPIVPPAEAMSRLEGRQCTFHCGKSAASARVG